MTSVLTGTAAILLLVLLAGAFVIGAPTLLARDDTYAQASISAVTQVSQAADLRNATSADETYAGTSAEDLLAGGFLARVPALPSGAEAVRLVGDDGTANGEPATVAVMKLAEGRSDDVCARIARRNGGGDVTTVVSSIPRASGGCFRTVGAVRSLDAGSLYAYSRV